MNTHREATPLSTQTAASLATRRPGSAPRPTNAQPAIFVDLHPGVPRNDLALPHSRPGQQTAMRTAAVDSGADVTRRRRRAVRVRSPRQQCVAARSVPHKAFEPRVPA
jgi:hypothetical protein